MALLPYTLAANRCLHRLCETDRAAVIRAATSLASVPWIREGAQRAADTDWRVLGRFDIQGPGDVPWPSVLVELRRRPVRKGQSDRKALIAVYLNPDQQWEVSERESEAIPWSLYRGNREGPASVLNGDSPAQAPASTT